MDANGATPAKSAASPNRDGFFARLFDPKVTAAVFSGIFALGSGLFSVYSKQQAGAAQASAQHVSDFSAEIQQSTKVLTASSGAEAARSIELISLYSLARDNPEDKRDVLYIAAASDDPQLLQFFGELLKNANGSDDEELRREYYELLTSLQTQRTPTPPPKSSAPQAGDAAIPQGATQVNTAIVRALGDVTDETQGWVYLGRATQTQAGSELTTGYIVPRKIPTTSPAAVVTTTGYLHLRNKGITPESGSFGPVVGVVGQGRSMRVERLVALPFSKGGYAIWGLVHLCTGSCS